MVRAGRQVVRGLITLGIVGMLTAIGAFVAAGRALEGNYGPTTADPVYDNGPNGPTVFIIGDSISKNGSQNDIFAWVNGMHGWHTHILATPGSNITNHQGWGDIARAAASNAAAVVIEQGVDDVALIPNFGPMTASQTLIETAKVFNAVDQTVKALQGKCVVWIGLNEEFNNYTLAPQGRLIFDDTRVVKAFDDHVKFLTATHPNLHYADYTAMVANDPAYRNSLYADGTFWIHPLTWDGHTHLAAFEVDNLQKSCRM